MDNSTSPSRKQKINPHEFTFFAHHSYTQREHAQHLQISIDKGLYRIDHANMHEYCVATLHLKQLYMGLVELPQLPVRTVVILIRPDVLCGAVMDGVNQTVANLQGTVHKRQGGHLQGYIPSRAIDHPELSTVYESYYIDVQLCTAKSKLCERSLVIRIYSSPLDQNEPPPQSDLLLSEHSEHAMFMSNHSLASLDKMDMGASLHLREACSLIQRLESPDLLKKIKVTGDLENEEFVKYTVKKHLLEHYRGSPSVREGEMTFPSLNAEDWDVVQSSWRFVENVWTELETRDLTFSTLETSFFGAFPAQPSLDQHYCSHLRRLSRENMIVQLLKSAGDLEKYAREAEYACANMIALLQPTFEAYGIEAPPLPKPKALTEYPLEFTAPQTACPPWGQKVMEALNQIQSDTGPFDPSQPQMMQKIDGAASIAAAQKAVASVIHAFEQQDDEERNARLQRKNLQVMDRLAKMQAHQKLSIKSLQDSTHVSEKARKAAEEMQSKIGAFEVPLTKWSVLVGGATGTCIVTPHHVLFSTQRIPVIGGSTTKTFALANVTFTSTETSPSILNPLPTIIGIQENGQEVYSFRPSSGGMRLKSFLDIVKAAATERLID